MEVEIFIEPHLEMITCGFMTEDQRKGTAIQLLKSMYGNVDAAIKFFNIFSTHITDKNGMNTKLSLTDPHLFLKLNSDN